MRNKESSDKSGLNACYEKANNTLPEKLPYITYAEAEKAARRIAIKFGKRKYASPTVLWEFSKKPFIRKNWVCLSGNSSNLHRGWKRLIHDMAHRIFRYRNPGLPDHCKLQADFEVELQNYVLKMGWLNGSLKPKPKVKLSSDEKKQFKIKVLKRNILRWESKAKRANTYLKKSKKKLKRLDNN